MEFIVVADQLRYILYALIFGIFASMLYFCIKIIRMVVGVTAVNMHKLSFLRFNDRLMLKSFKIGTKLREIIFVHILDIIYFVVVSISFCIFAFYFNHGRIRWYLVFSAIMGYFIFDNSIGRLLMYVSIYIVYVIKSFTKLIIYVILKSVNIALKPMYIVMFNIRLIVNHKTEYRKVRKYIFIKEESNGT